MLEIEWLHATTVRELQTDITAIRNAVYTGRTLEAMEQLRRLSARLDLYRRGDVEAPHAQA
jgi:hypothetical protein